MKFVEQKSIKSLKAIKIHMMQIPDNAMKLTIFSQIPVPSCNLSNRKGENAFPLLEMPNHHSFTGSIYVFGCL